MKGARISGLAVLMVAAGWAFASLASAAECPAAEAQTAVVADVVDGATLKLSDGTLVRLAGVEAPPRPLGLLKDAHWPVGEASRDGLSRMVAEAKIGLAFVGDAPDRYGRRHAWAFLPDGRSLQAVLLAAGSVRARWYPDESACLLTFLAAEAPARKAKEGLWADPEFAIRSAYDPSLLDRNGLYDLVLGRVSSVGHGSPMVFLDFGQNFRRDFTVMVPPAVAGALEAAGRAADTFKGRRVLVRGVIEDSGGPAIRLNDPGEIEVVDDVKDGADTTP